MLRKVLLLAGALLFVMAAPAAAQYGPITVVEGASFTVTGQGCGPNAPVTISITPHGQSGPTTVIGSGTTGPDGSFSFPVTIPVGTTPGLYDVHSSCGTVVEGAQVNVVAPSTGGGGTGSGTGTPLPRTGFDVQPYAEGGVLLIAVGGLLVLGTRRRHRSHLA